MSKKITVSVAQVGHAVSFAKGGDAPLVEDMRTLLGVIEGQPIHAADGEWVHEALNWLIDNVEEDA